MFYNDSESTIRVSVYDLLEKIQNIEEDNYATVELKFIGDEYSNELRVAAVAFDSEEPISYGVLQESDEEFED